MSLPYIPAFEAIKPEEHASFDTTPLLKELYKSDGQQPILGLLTDDLRLIYDRYIEYTNPNSPNYQDAQYKEYEEDAKVARLILETISSRQVKMTEELRQVIGDGLYARLGIMLKLRSDEEFLGQVASKPFSADAGNFYDLVLRLDAYDVQPQNVNSFKNQAGSEYFKRIEDLYMAVASRGLCEGKAEEAISLLSQLVSYGDGDKLYALSRSFKPMLQNPDYFSQPSASFAGDGRSWLKTEAGYRLFYGLTQFLEGDVKGEHDPCGAILNDIRQAAIYKINLPEQVEVREGETKVFENVFTSNVLGSEYEMEVTADIPKEARDRILVDYNKRENKLTIKAAKNEVNHEQYSFTIQLKSKVTNLTLQYPNYTPTVDAESRASIINENEPPTLIVKGPSHVVEGALFCMEAEVFDPEGDEVKIDWKQTDGPKGNVVEHEGRRKVCVQSKPTGKIEKPFQFDITAKDVIPPEHPSLSSRNAEKSLLIYNLPRIMLGEEAIDLPPDIIIALTDPKADDMGAIVYATTGLYVFLRMPDSLDKYGYKINADIANEVNASGCNGKAVPEEWSPFKRIASDSTIFAYYTERPIEPWIKPGRRSFSKEASVTLEHVTKPILATVRIKGDAEIKGMANALNLSVGELEVVSNSMLRIPFKITNAIYDGKPLLVLPQQMPVKITVSGKTKDEYTVTLAKKVMADLQESAGSDATYNIEIPLPAVYILKENTLSVSLVVESVRGGKAELTTERGLYNSGSSVFDDIRLVNPDHQMPFPWLMVDMQVERGRQYPHLLQRMIAGENKFSLWRSNYYDGEIPISAKKEWMILEDGRIRVPLGFADRGAAMGFIKDGSFIVCRSSFSLPADITQQDAGISDTWDVTMKWWSPIKTASVRIPKYPEDSRLVKRSSGKDNGETRTSSKQEEKPDPLVEAYLVAQKGLEEFVKASKASLVEKEVYAGDTFHIDLIVPSKPGIYDLEVLKYYGGDAFSRQFVIVIKDGNGNVYSSGATNWERIEGNDKITRLTFEVPKILLRGDKNTAWLKFDQRVYAHYRVHYRPETADEEFEREMTPTIFPWRHWVLLNDLVIHGGSRNEKLEGEGGSIIKKKTVK